MYIFYLNNRSGSNGTSFVLIPLSSRPSTTSPASGSQLLTYTSLSLSPKITQSSRRGRQGREKHGPPALFQALPHSTAWGMVSFVSFSAPVPTPAPTPPRPQRGPHSKQVVRNVAPSREWVWVDRGGGAGDYLTNTPPARCKGRVWRVKTRPGPTCNEP